MQRTESIKPTLLIPPGDRRRFKAEGFVPIVSTELLAELREALFESRVGTAAQRLVWGAEGLNGRADPEEVIDVCCRVAALYNLVQGGELNDWIFVSSRDDGIRFRDPVAIQRAAALTPLRHTENLLLHAFGLDGFLEIALREAKAMGHA